MMSAMTAVLANSRLNTVGQYQNPIIANIMKDMTQSLFKQ